MPYNCPSCKAEIPDAIPKSRLDDESDKRKEAEAELKTLRGKTSEQETQIKLLEKDAKKVSAAEGELATMREDRELEKLAGKWEMDGDAAAEFRRRWRELPSTKEAPRPKYEDYMKGLAKEPDNVPGFLRDHLPEFDDAGAVVPREPAQKGVQMREVPNLDRGSPREGNRTKGKGQITGQEMQALAQRANAGDVKALRQYTAMRGQIAQQMGIELAPLPASNPLAPPKDAGGGAGT